MEAQHALAMAQKACREKNLQDAWNYLTKFLILEPDDFRGLMFESKLHWAAGDFRSATVAINEAIRTAPHFATDAYLEMLSQRVAQMEWGVCGPEQLHDTRDMINISIDNCQDSPSIRWNLGRLYFLRGLHSLAFGDLARADRDIGMAYERNRGEVPDDEFLFPWVRDQLKRHQYSPDLPNLKYLSWVVDNPEPTISYDEQLAHCGDDTFVLEIGAMDGVKFDPLHRHLTTRPWHAVLIEPTTAMYADLARNYARFPNIKCVKAAISSRDGFADIHFIKPEFVQAGKIEPWALGISRLTPLANFEEFSDSETVPTLTFASLMWQHDIRRIDVLQIDTEGHEYEIFRQIDLALWPRRLLQIEIAWLMPADRVRIIEALLAHRFRLSYDGTDIAALRLAQ